MASPRLPSPLIKLDVRVSRIQLSDRFHREAHDVALVARGACAASSNIFASRHSPFRQVRLFGCLQAKGQSPQHLRHHERTRSQGPFLRRRYPASSVIRPCPTPADIAIQDSVEAATLMPNGSPPITSSSPDVIRAMSTELFLNFLGIRMDSRKAEGMRFTINLITPDNDEKFLVELENATLTNIKGFLARNPNLTLTINRSDLEQTMMGAKTLEAQIADGTATVEGDAVILKQLASTMVDFDPRFEIMPGTKARETEAAKSDVHYVDPYEAVPRQTIAE